MSECRHIVFGIRFVLYKTSTLRVRQSVCYMQIPFMIMQHVKHKASALITSTHPPTTVLLPTSLPAEKKGWVGEG